MLITAACEDIDHLINILQTRADVKQMSELLLINSLQPESNSDADHSC